MLASVYIVIFMLGLAIAIGSSIHYLVVRNRDRSHEVSEVIEVLKGRERGADVPMPDHSVFYRGTLPTALFASFVSDGLVGLFSGSFVLQDVVLRAAMNTIAAGGVQYAVTQLRHDKTSAAWPNSPWLCWLLASALGLLGGVAEATSPGSLTQ